MSQSGSAVRLVIISVPPEPLLEEFENIKQIFMELSGSKAALQYPAHVTLRTGAIVPATSMAEFVAAFSKVAIASEPCQLQCADLVFESMSAGVGQGAGSCFAGYEVCSSAPLMSLHRSLVSLDLFRKSLQTRFNPHLTLAFDDLDDIGLQEIKEWCATHPQLIPVAPAWVCESADLYHQVDGVWHLLHRSPLGGMHL